MWKSVPRLRGMAMCYVVLAHALHQVPATYLLERAPLVPSEQPVAYLVMMVAQGWAPISLHAFLAASGFVTFKFTRGGESWALARQILRKYLTWAIPMFCILAIKTRHFDYAAILEGLFVGGPVNAYWFLVLIAWLYLIAPPLVRLVRARPRTAALLAVIISVGNAALFYWVDSTWVKPFWSRPIMAAVRFLPFFLCGMIAAKGADSLGPWLFQHKTSSRWSCALSTVLVSVESFLIARHQDWIIPPHGRMYAVERATLPLLSLSVLAVLTTVEIKPALSQWFNHVGNQSLGILLLMDLFQSPISHAVWHIPRSSWPAASAAYAHHQLPAAITTHALWFALPMFVAGLWGPLYAMDWAKRLLGRHARMFF